jgi:hypothetical protein
MARRTLVTAGDRIFGVPGRGQGEFQLCRVRTAPLTSLGDGSNKHSLVLAKQKYIGSDKLTGLRLIFTIADAEGPDSEEGGDALEDHDRGNGRI